MISNLEKRVQHLEETMAFQDETIESLNGVIIDQQKQLDSLNLTLEKLQGALTAMNTEQGQVLEPPPPHY
ncbi:MAG: SlyX family protein [Desulfotalea sp.]